jgi:NAD(P)H dehydrogenase (quinone)
LRKVAAILKNPTAHAGAIYKLFGPVELDVNGIAAAMSEVLKRAIRYSPTEISDFQLSAVPRKSEQSTVTA